MARDARGEERRAGRGAGDAETDDTRRGAGDDERGEGHGAHGRRRGRLEARAV